MIVITTAVRTYFNGSSLYFGEHIAMSANYVLVSARGLETNHITLQLYDQNAHENMYTSFTSFECGEMSLSITRDGLLAAVGCPFDGTSGQGIVYIFQLPSFARV
jgi:hypothetical protein